MSSMADRRGRSAARADSTPISVRQTRTGTAPGRRKRAPPPVVGEGSALATAPVVGTGSTQSVADRSSDWANRHHLLFCDLRAAIDDVIADDADWLERQYGFGALLESLHDIYGEMIDTIAAQSQRIARAEQDNQTAKRLHDSQQEVLGAIEFDSWGTLPTLQESVKALETEILKLCPDRSLDVPDALMKVNAFQRFIALKFARQEDLLYLMRKRLSQISLDLSLSQCVEQFSSLENMLKEMNRLRSDNTRLRLREQRFRHDSLLKRRRLRECSPELLRTLIVALQNELGAVQNMMERLSMANHPLSALLAITDDDGDHEDDRGELDIDQLYDRIVGDDGCHDGHRVRGVSTTAQPVKKGVVIRPISTMKNDLEHVMTIMKPIGTTGGDGKESGPVQVMNQVKGVRDGLDHIQTTIDEQEALAVSMAKQLRDQREINFKLTTIVVHWMNCHPEICDQLPETLAIDPMETVPFALADFAPIALAEQPDGRDQAESESPQPHRRDSLRSSISAPPRVSIRRISRVNGDESQSRSGQRPDQNGIISASPSIDTLIATSIDLELLLDTSAPFVDRLVNKFTNKGESPFDLAVFTDLCKSYNLVPERISRPDLTTVFEAALGGSSRRLVDRCLTQLAMAISPSIASAHERLEHLLDALQTEDDDKEFDRNHRDGGTGIANDLWRLMDRFDAQIRRIFTFYSKTQISSERGTPFDTTTNRSSKAMNLAEFVLMAKQFDLCPALVSVRDLAQVFGMANVGERSDGQLYELSYPEFKEALARLSLVYGEKGESTSTDPAVHLSNLFSYMDLNNLTPQDLRAKLRGFAATNGDAKRAAKTGTVSSPQLDPIVERVPFDPLHRSEPILIDKELVQSLLSEFKSEIPILEKVFLFYARAIRSQAVSFDSARRANNLLSQGELNLFCRDFRITPALITRRQSADLFLSTLSSSRSPSKSLLFPNFIEWLYRVAISAFPAQSSPSDLFRTLLTHLDLIDSSFERIRPRLKGQLSVVGLDDAPVVVAPIPNPGPRSPNNGRWNSVPIWELQKLNVVTCSKECLTTLSQYEPIICDIFSTYSRLQVEGQGHRTFDQIKGQNDSMNQGELIRMFTDFDLVGAMVTMQEIGLLYRASRSGSDALTIGQFRDCLLRAARIAFAPEKPSGFATIEAQVEALLGHLDVRAQSRRFRQRDREEATTTTTDSWFPLPGPVLATISEHQAMFDQIYNRYRSEVVQAMNMLPGGFASVLKDYQLVAPGAIANAVQGVFGTRPCIDRREFSRALVLATGTIQSGEGQGDDIQTMIDAIRRREDMFNNGLKRSV